MTGSDADARMERLAAAYVARDYATCVALGLDDLAEVASLEYTLIFFIALTRAGRPRLAADLAAPLLPSLEGEPLHAALLRAVTGQATPGEVLALAQTPEDRCRAAFYCGARLLSDRRFESALALLSEAAAAPCDLVEAQLAAADRDEAAAPERADVDWEAVLTGMNDRLVEMQTAGRYLEALSLAEETVALAEARLGEGHRLRATSIHNRGSVFEALGRIDEAELDLCRAGELRLAAAGRDHPDHATTLLGMAAIKRARGQLADAIALHHEALERLERDGDEERTATALNNLAMLEQAAGGYAHAARAFAAALELRRRRFGDQHLSTVTVLYNLGTLAYELGRYDQAEAHWRRGVDALHAGGLEEHPQLAYLLAALGRLADTLGRHREGAARYREALDILRPALGDEHPHVLALESNLGVALDRLGAFDDAAARNEDVLARRRRKLGDEHPDVALSLNNLAASRAAAGRIAEARDLYVRAAAICEARLGPEHPDLARMLCNIAGTNRRLGRYSAAEAGYRRAAEIIRHRLGIHHPLFATALHHVAWMRLETGDHRTAEALFHQVLSIRRDSLGPEHPLVAGALDALGILERLRGNPRAALGLHGRALRLRLHFAEASPIEIARGFGNIGAALQARGRFAAARKIHESTLDRLRGAGPPAAHDLAGALNDLAAAELALGLFDSARIRLLEALELRGIDLSSSAAASPGATPSELPPLVNLALIEAATGRGSEAQRIFLEVARREEQILGAVFSIASERQRLAFCSEMEERLDAALSLVTAGLVSLTEARDLSELVLRRKGLVLEAALFERQAADGSLDTRRSLRRLHRVRGKLARRLWTGPGPAGVEAHERRLRRWSELKENVESALARHLNGEAMRARLAGATWECIAARVPPGTSLAEILRVRTHAFGARPGEPRWRGGRYLAWVVSGSVAAKPLAVDLGPAEVIEALVLQWREAVHTFDPTELELGRRLREAVVDPIRAAAPSSTRWMIAVDGLLHQLPFAALPAQEGGRLIDQLEINYLDTARDVLRSSSAGDIERGPPVVVADPRFDLSSSGLEISGVRRFPPLPGSRLEGERVAELLGVAPWLGEDALESRLKSISSPRVLHIATHGFFLPAAKPPEHAVQSGVVDLRSPSGLLASPALVDAALNPLARSGLALAGAENTVRGEPIPKAAEDGILSAEEAAGLDLDGTEVVVLSACETGLGDIRHREGVFGLRRALFEAGAARLILALWRVPDASTLLLMEELHLALREGVPPEQALRSAQLATRRVFPEPLLWGGFISIGGASLRSGRG